MFKVAPLQILYCYSVWQDKFEEMVNTVKNIFFHEGLSDETEFDPYKKEHTVCVIDDLLADAKDNKLLHQILCVGGHHSFTYVFFVVQNLFQKGKILRSVSLNTHVFILYKNRRDQIQIRTLARQMYPDNPSILINCYIIATNNLYGYLVIDISQHSKRKYHLRTNIFPGEDVIVFATKIESWSI